MNFYLIEKADEKKAPELLSTIKQFLKERLSGAIEDPVLQLAYGGSNAFFLKTQASILWVRVLEKSLTHPDISGLRQDFERVSQKFHQKIRFYVFAPGYEEDLKMTAMQPQETLFFEYFFLRSRFGQGVALRELKIRFSAPPSPGDQETVPVFPAAAAHERFRNVRLDREELSELINLSLELKRLSPAPPSTF